MERLAARAPVRLAERWLAQGEATLEGRGAAAAETQRVVDAFVEAAACGGDAECADAAAGRVVFRRGAYVGRVDIPRKRVAATPRPRRGYSVGTSRAAAATWIFRGNESRRRRGCDVDIP